MNYMIYWYRMIRYAVIGSKTYYSFLSILGFFSLIGFVAYIIQLVYGLETSNMTNQVSWGAYIANFSYLVGVADAGVVLVVAAYVLKHRSTEQLIPLALLLALTSIIMSLLFIIVDLGRPDRFLHMIPPYGILNFPNSILAWDVLALNVYLWINLFFPAYLLYKMYCKKQPTKWMVMPIVIFLIFWSIFAHTITAFLYSGLGGRPYWNTAIMAPRFLVSAFAVAPAFLVIAFAAVNSYSGFCIRRRPEQKIFYVGEDIFEMLAQKMMIFLPISLFLFGCFIFKEFYTDSVHAESIRYLFFGIDGARALVPYTWASIVMNVVAMIVVCSPLRRNRTLLVVASVFTIVGIWIEKGMGIVVPGFIPSSSGAIVEYSPSLIETLVCLGIWSFGVLIYTVMTKVCLGIQTERLSIDGILWDKV